MTTKYPVLAIAFQLLAMSPMYAQLSILTQFDPTNTGGTCGIAYNSPDGEIMVIGCSAGTIDRYAEDGSFISSATMVGEAANDVDIDMSPVDLVMNGTFVAQGQLLLINGETSVADIYAIDEATNEVIDTLIAGFGDSHVVGGSYHPQRGTFFLVQDYVPGGFSGNRVAEVDAATGDTIQTFSVQPYFDVNYGDLDISPVSGHLFIVSSNETTIAEFTPDGVFVQEHVLPTGVSDLSGIALDNDLQGAWVCNTNGTVFKLGNFPIGISEVIVVDPFIQVFPNPANDHVELLLEVERSANYSIVVHDVAGRVAQLHYNGTLPTGRHRIPVNASTLSVGCYSILVTGPGISVSRSLLVLR